MKVINRLHILPDDVIMLILAEYLKYYVTHKLIGSRNTLEQFLSQIKKRPTKTGIKKYIKLDPIYILYNLDKLDAQVMSPVIWRGLGEGAVIKARNDTKICLKQYTVHDRNDKLNSLKRGDIVRLRYKTNTRLWSSKHNPTELDGIFYIYSYIPKTGKSNSSIGVVEIEKYHRTIDVGGPYETYGIGGVLNLQDIKLDSINSIELIIRPTEPNWATIKKTELIGFVYSGGTLDLATNFIVGSLNGFSFFIAEYFGCRSSVNPVISVAIPHNCMDPAGNRSIRVLYVQKTDCFILRNPPPHQRPFNGYTGTGKGIIT
jgi:hypothetical protein